MTGGRVAGRIAFVTGAGAGIGRAVAIALAAEGARVLVADRAGAAAEEVAAGIVTAGGAAESLTLDVTDEGDWALAARFVAARAGHLDILVNNAGVGGAVPFAQMSLAHWRRVLAVNLDGVFLGCHVLLDFLRKSPQAAIVNIASVLGKVGEPMLTAYCASKGGVTLFTKALALEAAANGWPIRVNSVHPGYVDTPMVQGAIAMSPDPARAATRIVARQPLGRLATPEEVAAAVLFLSCDESRFMTGSELVVDGGLTAA